MEPERITREDLETLQNYQAITMAFNLLMGLNASRLIDQAIIAEVTGKLYKMMKMHGRASNRIFEKADQ